MRRIFLGVSLASFACALGALPAAATVEHPAAYDAFIAKQAKKHGVPERLVHRILMRESRYDPKVFHNHCYGLMQIKYGTARSMGFSGAPQGLFDPYINMTYAIPYLANAYRVAEGDEDRAVTFFAAGYYYTAKKKQLLAALRTANSPPLAPEPPPPATEAPRNAAAGLFAFLQNSPPIPSLSQDPWQSPQALAPQAGPATGAQADAAQAPAAPAPALAYAEQAPSAAQAQTAAPEPAAPEPQPAKTPAKAGTSKSVSKTKTVVALAGKKAPPAEATQAAKAAQAKVPSAMSQTEPPPAARVQTAAVEPAAPEPKPVKAPAKSAQKNAQKSRIVVALAEKSTRAAEAAKPHIHAAQTAKDAKARVAAANAQPDAPVDTGAAPQAAAPSAQDARGDGN